MALTKQILFMPLYYCPFCSPEIKLKYKRSDNPFICKRCGERLLEVKLIKPTQCIAFLAILGLITPLVLMVISAMEENKKQEIITLSKTIEYSIVLDKSRSY